MNAHNNPAYAAAVLSWMGDNYSRFVRKYHATEQGMNPAFAIVGLSLVSSSSARRFLGSPAKDLGRLGAEIPEWRLHTAKLMQAWSVPFWPAVTFGTAKGMLQFTAGRLYSGFDLKAETDALKEIRSAARNFGAIVGKVHDDGLRWRKLTSVVPSQVNKQILEAESL